MLKLNKLTLALLTIASIHCSKTLAQIPSQPQRVTGSVSISGAVNVDTVNKDLDVDALIGGYGSAQLKYILEWPSPSLADDSLLRIAKGLLQMDSGTVGIPATIKQETTIFVKSLLTKNDSDRFGNNEQARKARFAYCIPGSDTWISSTKSKFVDGNPCSSTNLFTGVSITATGTPSYPMNAAFSADTLLEPTAYSGVTQASGEPPQNIPALDYISYLSGLAKSMKLPDILQKNEIDAKAVNDEAIKDKLLDLRTMVASYSMGLYALNKVYANRLPTIPNSITENNVTKKLVPTVSSHTVSPLQIEEYMASRRINDTTWRNAIEKATPVNLQREIVYLLADQLYESYKIHRELEQANALSASAQLTMMNQLRQAMDAQSGANGAIPDAPSEIAPPSTD